MILTVNVPQQIDAKFLVVRAGVQYWEDTLVNGEEEGDIDGKLIPCRVGEYWWPVIDVDSGVIMNWTPGVTAKVCYKICDDGYYSVMNSLGKAVFGVEQRYVPNVLDTSGKYRKGYSKHIIMSIDETGKIAEWNGALLQEFIESNVDNLISKEIQ